MRWRTNEAVSSSVLVHLKVHRQGLAVHKGPTLWGGRQRDSTAIVLIQFQNVNTINASWAKEGLDCTDDFSDIRLVRGRDFWTWTRSLRPSTNSGFPAREDHSYQQLIGSLLKLQEETSLLCEVPGQLTGSEEPGILSSLWSPTAQICLFCEKEAMALDRLFLPGLVSESAPRPWGRFWNPPFDKLNWNVFKKNILPFQNSNPKIHFHSFHWNFGEGPRKKKEERKKNWFI